MKTKKENDILEPIPKEAKNFMEELGSLLKKYHARIAGTNSANHLVLNISVGRYAFYLMDNAINELNYMNNVFVHTVHKS